MNHSDTTDLLNRMVEASVATHGVLETPSGSAMSLAQRATEVMSKLYRYESTLRSIANSTCCDRCNEAKLVAQAALKP